MSKWSAQYWKDFMERVGSTGLYGLATFLTMNLTDTMAGDAKQFWLIVGLPMALSAIKNLLVNMKSDTSTASVVGVTSNQLT